MDDLDQITRILVAFARNGFEKVTMNQIAEAAGISRQTLYNRYKTKEGILAWASEGFSRQARLKGCAELNNGDGVTADCLVAAFSERMGILVPMVHGLKCGPQILDLGPKLRRQAHAEFPPFHADFTKDLTFFLQSRDVCRSLSEAKDTAYLLMMSGKGLLMDTRTREDFDAGMARVVAVLLREPAVEAPASTQTLEDTSQNFLVSGGKTSQ